MDDADPSVEWVAEAGHFHLYLETPDVEEVARRLRAAGVTLQCEPADKEWQTRELIFLDDQGHTIYVGQALSR
ncbi:MAG: VOC family protein [Gemmatimonadales bacterium]